MFTTATQLLDLTDKKLVLVLRDGRKLLGILRSWDQFANLVLTSTVERLFVVVPTTTTNTASTSSASTHPDPETNAPTHVDGETGTRTLYCDIPRGTYLVRGENVLLLGEVDLDRDDSPPPGCEVGDVAEIFRLRSAEEERRKVGDKIRGRRAAEWWGGEVEGSGEVLFY